MKQHGFEIYQSVGYWFWRLRAANGKIIADGAEGYKTKTGVKNATLRLMNTILFNGQYLNIKEVTK